MASLFDDIEVYGWLLTGCSKYGIDPSVPIESEDYFRNLLSQYSGENDRAQFIAWLEKHITNNFVTLARRPEWIQNPEWPFSNGLPMIYVGQIDISVKD